MCARYAFFNGKVVADDLGVTPLPDLEPRYNIAPMQTAPVIVPSDGGWDMEMMRWGLIPSWAKDETIAQKLINARGEPLREKPSFRAAYKRRRCVIPANGFYEWSGKRGSKQPFFITLRGSDLMPLAGLWEEWETPEALLHTFTIITTEPNELISPIHTRMPVILAPEDVARWLDSDGVPVEEASQLLVPYPADEMQMTAVHPEVGRVVIDHPGLIEPIEKQTELF
jgi:putative SOS response-associated peptidase YedK